jgi:hypothetical protein
MVIGTRVLLETILMIFQMADHLTNEGMVNKGIIEREENAESRDGIQWNI